MNLITVRTGSDQGNCYLVESNGRYVALDCGAKWKDVMVACGFSVYAIQVAFLSHFHKDHSSHARDFIRNGIPLFTNKETASKFGFVHSGVAPEPNTKNFLYNGNWFIPFEVPHTDNDGDTPCQNYAFLFEIDGERFLYMTDWMFCPFILEKFKINHFIIAINYSDEISERHVLNGHASLNTAVEFLKSSMTESCKSISICHVSDRNADEALILETIKQLAGDKVNVNICKKGETIDL